VCEHLFSGFKTNLGSTGDPGQILGKKGKMHQELGLGARGVETETDKENCLFDLQRSHSVELHMSQQCKYAAHGFLVLRELEAG
jgi:hypothetical protein